MSDSAEIIRKLRCLALPDPYDERPVMHAKLHSDAADLIESLRAENASLREGIEEHYNAAEDAQVEIDRLCEGMCSHCQDRLLRKQEQGRDE